MKGDSGDYLWDKSGPRDPELVRLEQVLGTLRHVDGRTKVRRYVPTYQKRPLVILSALAGLAAGIVLVAFVWWARTPPASGLSVIRVAGTPTIGTRPVTSERELGVGRWLETDAASRATVDVAGIGRVDVDPGTRVGLVSTRPGQHRLELARGTIHALIWAPPGQFFIETSSSTALDLGCAYAMSMDDDGVGLVRVTTGWVGFEYKGGEAFIPAGAVCVTRPGLGPGTPHFDDTSDAYQAAIDLIDLGRGTPAAMDAAIARVISESREQDKVTLWHLLSRVDSSYRDRVFDRLAGFVAPPAGVTKDGVRAGGPTAKSMLDDWWDALGLGTSKWWRTWKQQWR